MTEDGRLSPSVCCHGCLHDVKRVIYKGNGKYFRRSSIVSVLMCQLISEEYALLKWDLGLDVELLDEIFKAHHKWAGLEDNGVSALRMCGHPQPVWCLSKMKTRLKQRSQGASNVSVLQAVGKKPEKMSFDLHKLCMRRELELGMQTIWELVVETEKQRNGARDSGGAGCKNHKIDILLQREQFLSEVRFVFPLCWQVPLR